MPLLHKMKATKKVSEQCALPDGYEPQPQDILSGRTRESYNHEGNKAFRSVISKQLPLYFALEKRKKRQDLITSILDRILADGGRFLMKEKDHHWVALTRAQAHKKVSHALRDAAFRNVVRQSKVDNNDEQYFLDSDESSSMDRPKKRSKTEPSIEDLVWTDLGISDSFEDDDDGHQDSSSSNGGCATTQSLANCLPAVQQHRPSDWFAGESRSSEFKLFDWSSDWVF